MPGQPHSRSLPGRPNLRYLKLEAKRRIAAGEFPSLHEAQVAIAREHGLPSWAALKRQIGEDQDSHALSQLRWVISRFAGAGGAGLDGSGRRRAERAFRRPVPERAAAARPDRGDQQGRRGPARR